MRLLGIWTRGNLLCFPSFAQMVEHSRFHRIRANDVDANACAGGWIAADFVMPSTACLLPTYGRVGPPILPYSYEMLTMLPFTLREA